MPAHAEPSDAPTTEIPRVGAGAQPAGRSSWLRRHRLAAGLGAGAVLAVALGTAVGALAAADSAGSGPAAAAPAPTTAAAGPPTSAPATSAPPTSAAGRKTHRAVIVAENGSSWTIRTTDGTTVRVAMTSHTHFGTRAHPEAPDTFRPGDRIVVAGTLTGATPTATRVAHVRTDARSAPSPTPSAATTGS